MSDEKSWKRGPRGRGRGRAVWRGVLLIVAGMLIAGFGWVRMWAAGLARIDGGAPEYHSAQHNAAVDAQIRREEREGLCIIAGGVVTACCGVYVIARGGRDKRQAPPADPASPATG